MNSKRDEKHTVLLSQSARCRCGRAYTRVHVGRSFGPAPDYCGCGAGQPLNYGDEEWGTEEEAQKAIRG